MTFHKNIIVAENAPKGRGPFPQAVRSGAMVFVSGQGPLSAETNAPVAGDFAGQVLRTLDNVAAILAATGLDLRHIVKMTVYLSDLARVEEFNEIYRKRMPEPWPARTLVAAGLRGIDVEIDAIAIDPSPSAGG